MQVKFWGVRGSLPIPGPATIRYGGNTPCIEVRGGQGECIVFEAGTGIRALGLDILRRAARPPAINLFISHTHWDHIQGFPFFTPCYIPRQVINLRGPVHYVEGKSLQKVFDLQMQHEFFPISNNQLAADIRYEGISEAELEIGQVHIRTQFMNHSIQSLGYRLTEGGKSIVYTGDHEPYYDVFKANTPRPMDSDDDGLFGEVESIIEDATGRFVDFVRGADLFVVDCQYTPEEYPSKKRTWGHSSWDYCLEWMKQAGARSMVLTHHDPMRSDDEVDAILKQVRQAAGAQGIDPETIMMAHEGMEITV